ncbi:MAG: ATP-binding protein [Eubacteriaceae bacterium]|nr:ATP-binding protein [Eubacteriaceae bacterium]
MGANDTMSMFIENRSQRRKEFLANRNKIYMALPQLPSLVAEKYGIYISSLDEKFEEVAQNARIAEIDSRIAAILKAAGLDADAIQYKPACAICQDTGFVDGIACACLNRVGAEQAQKAAKVYGTQNFESFKLAIFSDIKEETERQSQRKEMALLQKKARKYAMEMPLSQGQNLLFIGKAGTGKTFLSNCIACEITKMGFFVSISSANDLTKVLIDKAFGRDEAGLSDVYYNCDLLVIDDLGFERDSALAEGELLDLINSRLAKKKNMIAITSMDLVTLKNSYSDSIFSRLAGEFDAWRFIGEDVRAEAAKKKKRS